MKKVEEGRRSLKTDEEGTSTFLYLLQPSSSFFCLLLPSSTFALPSSTVFNLLHASSYLLLPSSNLLPSRISEWVSKSSSSSVVHPPISIRNHPNKKRRGSPSVSHACLGPPGPWERLSEALWGLAIIGTPHFRDPQNPEFRLHTAYRYGFGFNNEFRL